MNEASSQSPKVIELTPQWLVVCKPAGMLTIPGRESPLSGSNPDPNPKATDSLLEWAKKHYSPVWVVHRLDRETSGVLLMARTEDAHRRASLWFQNREMKKYYHCLAEGVPPLPVFRIKTPVAGAPSNTQVEVLESYEQGFFARVAPQTGRRHQIRIHLSQNGFPIWGDGLYRGPSQIQLGEGILNVARVALHASLLQLPSGEKFEAPLPVDMSGWLSTLRSEGRRA